VEKCGNCLATAPDRAEAVRAAETACRSVFIRLESPNDRTDAFLSEGPTGLQAFPPDAFCLPPDTYPIKSVFCPLPARADDKAGKTVRDTIPIPESIIPFLDTVYDWQGRSIREALDVALAAERGLLAVLSGTEKKDAIPYWNALLRGGIQGIVYAYDRDHR